MSFEINILVVGQKAPVSLPFDTELLLRNEIEHPDIGRYFAIWPLFMQTDGILYSIGRDPFGGVLEAFSVCDSDFEHPLPWSKDTDWIPADVRDCLTPLIINPSELNDVLRITSFLLDSSPKKLIMFHTRYQDGDSEIYCGVMEKDIFLKKLSHQELYFNICYIIKTERP